MEPASTWKESLPYQIASAPSEPGPMMEADATIFCSSTGAASSAEGAVAPPPAVRSAVAASSFEAFPAATY